MTSRQREGSGLRSGEPRVWDPLMPHQRGRVGGFLVRSKNYLGSELAGCERARIQSGSPSADERSGREVDPLGEGEGYDAAGCGALPPPPSGPGSRAAQPELQHYLEERIQPSRWYPEEDLLALIEAMLPLIPGPRADVLATLGTLTARDHLEGIYSHLSGAGRGSAPSSSRAFALRASQHDTGRFEVEHSAVTLRILLAARARYGVCPEDRGAEPGEGAASPDPACRGPFD